MVHVQGFLSGGWCWGHLCLKTGGIRRLCLHLETDFVKIKLFQTFQNNLLMDLSDETYSSSKHDEELDSVHSAMESDSLPESQQHRNIGYCSTPCPWENFEAVKCMCERGRACMWMLLLLCLYAIWVLGKKCIKYAFGNLSCTCILEMICEPFWKKNFHRSWI